MRKKLNHMPSSLLPLLNVSCLPDGGWSNCTVAFTRTRQSLTMVGITHDVKETGLWLLLRTILIIVSQSTLPKASSAPSSKSGSLSSKMAPISCLICSRGITISGPLPNSACHSYNQKLLGSGWLQKLIPNKKRSLHIRSVAACGR